MSKFFLGLYVGMISFFVSNTAFSHEFCVRRYEAELNAVHNEASNLLIRQANLDLEAQQLGAEEDKLPLLIQAALQEIPPNTELALRYTKRNSEINKRQDEIIAESFNIKNRLAALKGQLPADLGGKLESCIKDSAPANLAVNATLQAIAAYTLGPAAKFLPQKALYVDMSEIIVGGNIMGGPNSVPNQVKERINDILPKCNGCPKL